MRDNHKRHIICCPEIAGSLANLFPTRVVLPDPFASKDCFYYFNHVGKVRKVTLPDWCIWVIKLNEDGLRYPGVFTKIRG